MKTNRRRFKQMRIKPLRVTVIILNWNGKKFLEQNLNSVLTQTYENYEILVVDNGSDDGSIEYIKKLKKKQKKIALLETGKNLGYVGGNNAGINKVLKEGKNDYVVLLNNDVKVTKDWLANLLTGFDGNDIGICTSKIFLYYPYQQIVLVPNGDVILESLGFENCKYHLLEFPNGFDEKGELFLFPRKLKSGEIYNFGIPFVSSIQIKEEFKLRFAGESVKVFSGEEKKELTESGSVGFNLEGKYVIQNAGTDFIEKQIVFKDRKLFEFDRETPTQIVDAGCGCAMAIRSDLLKKLGGLEEKYSVYFEDVELSYRFSQKGFKTRLIRDAVCYRYNEHILEGECSSFKQKLHFVRQYFGGIELLGKIVLISIDYLKCLTKSVF